MNIIDTHTHTNFSFDGENSPREMINCALESGLHALTFTDHIDVNDYYDSHYNQSRLMPLAAAEIPALIEIYADKIHIGFGAEIGQYIQNPALSKRLIAEFKLDYVIGSTHSIRGYKDFYYLDFKNKELEPEKIMQTYFEETLEMVENADIDVIGHLTYPLRYITGRNHIPVGMSKYTDIIQEIFKSAVRRNIGLEINTGGLRKPEYNKADPGLEYIKLFRELGGEIITIGSDAHRTTDLAAHFNAAAEIAESAGFKKIAYFIKRKPVFVGLM
ncbi:MAG: histidinol-phosphatase HisJ family protein [Oscillospiraceae bacterium]|nr:histidinol-phosphatase HisJ family protein [Oscillospiraceae bacterium]